jgi:hypothetical protein
LCVLTFVMQWQPRPQLQPHSSGHTSWLGSLLSCWVLSQSKEWWTSAAACHRQERCGACVCAQMAQQCMPCRHSMAAGGW